jgi:preprotein translocase subunit YajC
VIIGASGGSGILFIIIIAFLLLYLLFVRPQKRRQNEQQQMISELRVGDEVLTVGGIYGTIAQLDDDRVTVEIAPKLEVQVSRRAIAGVTWEPDEPEVVESDEGAEPEADEGTSAETSNEENRG